MGFKAILFHSPLLVIKISPFIFLKLVFGFDSSEITAIYETDLSVPKHTHPNILHMHT